VQLSGIVDIERVFWLKPDLFRTGEKYHVSLHQVLAKRDLIWDVLIGVSALIALIANLVGLFIGITVVLPHLLYIPVVIAAYRYPKWGLFITGCIGAAYLLIVIVVAGISSITLMEAIVRTIVVVGIGWLIAWLSFRLRERQELFHGVFNNSEAGSILIRNTENGRVIEEVNEKAARLLERTPEVLKRSPPTSVWGRDFEEALFSQLDTGGAIHATEAEFLLPDGSSETVLVSAAPLPLGRTIITFVDITRRVYAEKALKAANDKLSLLSRIAKDHLQRTVDQMAETVKNAEAHCNDAVARVYFTRMQVHASNLTRQLLLTESYKNLGLSPPAWLGVQKILESAGVLDKTVPVSVRFWTERLEIYADPLFKDVLIHIAGNAITHGTTLKNLVVTYHETPEGLALILEDDGIGIPADNKQQIFEYDSGGHTGIGLFICREILGVTGMTIEETGYEGKGARIVIHVPPEGYRIEGTSEQAPAFPLPDKPVPSNIRGARHTSGTIVRELDSAEFPLAEALWTDYHQTKGDGRTGRIFAGFSEGEIVSVARCRKHPDGFEVDAVFTPPHHRGHGYAHAVMWGLVEACGHEPLYMHSLKNLTGFYGHSGFIPIGESELPPTIRERYAWAMGEMEGADVCPMKRPSPG
jgi:signal transduction histidine kinase/predicted GNAT family acetyltransferase